jgi:ParB/RepB/Spo0J family partition protein
MTTKRGKRLRARQIPVIEPTPKYSVRGSASAGRILLLALKDIKPNTFNPNAMPQQTYKMMLEDMRTGGPKAINPIEVRPVDGRLPYQIIDGESRYKGAQELGWTHIRAEVKPMSLEDAKAECYRKNKQRGTINPFREAELFKSEVDAGVSQRRIARKYGVSRRYIQDSLNLLTRIAPDIRKKVETLLVDPHGSTDCITKSHLESIASLNSEAQQYRLFEAMAGTVRQTKPSKPLLTVRQLEHERARLTHKPESPILPVEDLYWDNVWPPELERDKGYGNSTFPGNCSGTVCKQSLWRYTQEGDLVLDAMAGSGTMIDACKALKRRCIAFDIAPVPYRDDITFGDARSLPLSDESIDFIFIHFPYWQMYRYTKPPHPADLSQMSYEDFLRAAEDTFHEAKRVLKPGKFLVTLIGDMRKDLVFYDLPAEFSVVGRRVGLRLYDKVHKPTLHERSETPESKLLAIQYNFHLLKSETLLIFRKPQPD